MYTLLIATKIVKLNYIEWQNSRSVHAMSALFVNYSRIPGRL